MSTRPFADRNPRGIREINAALTALMKSVHSSARIELRSFEVARRRATSKISDQPWRLGIGMIAVIVPSLLLAMLGPTIPVTTPGIVFLLAVAISTYLADWVGGLTSLVLSALLLDLLFIGAPSDIGLPVASDERLGFAVTLLGGGVLIWLIQHIKYESQVDRRAAVTARAAANALASVESAAASHAVGTAEGRRSLNNSLLRAMVSINRAHIGMLFLRDPDSGELTLSASYGIDLIDRQSVRQSRLATELAQQIADERRWRRISDLSARNRSEPDLLDHANVRSLVGVPLIDAEDKVLGVVLAGLYVPHKFTPSEIARLDAMASRSAAVLRAAVGIDRRETALHTATEAKRWLELVIAAMPEAVVLAMPPDGRIVAQNQAAAHLLGQLLDSDTGHTIESRLTLPDGDAIDEASNPIAQAFATGEIVAGAEMLAMSASGVLVPVLVSAAPVREQNGPVVAVVAVFRDIASLKAASRLKDEFISVVSHELRSPLTPIRGFVQLVAKDLAREGGHDPHVGRLNSIAGHVDRMTRLVDDLLDVSRLKSGSLEIRRDTCDLVELCQEVVRDRSATTASHQFAFLSSSESLLGDWDSDRLYQVVDNLVGNAVKYTPPGGSIAVAVKLDSALGAACITVSDDGPGIATADRENVFSAFYRTPEAAASRIAGLGLGLYICHELVVAHGGNITAGAAASGGAAFTVQLPLVTTVEAAA